MVRFAAFLGANVAVVASAQRSDWRIYTPANGDQLRQDAQDYCNGRWSGRLLKDWNVAGIRDFSFVFANQPSCTPDVTKWNVQSATSMEGMFLNARSFNSDTSKWRVSKVTSFKNMFNGAASFNGKVEDWDVIINSTKFVDVENMFDGATSFETGIDVWPTWTVDTYGWNYTVIEPVIDLGLTPFQFFTNPPSPPSPLPTKPEQVWISVASECAAENKARHGCFYGSKTTNHFCLDVMSATIVADDDCTAIGPKPQPTRASCTVVDQCYREYPNEWTSCDNQCGAGYRYKAGVCTDLVDGKTAPQELCASVPAPVVVGRCQGQEDCTGRYWKTPGSSSEIDRDQDTCQTVNGKCYLRDKSNCNFKEQSGQVRYIPRRFRNYWGDITNPEWYEHCQEIPAPTMLTWLDVETAGFSRSVEFNNACCTKLGFDFVLPNTPGGRR